MKVWNGPFWLFSLSTRKFCLRPPPPLLLHPGPEAACFEERRRPSCGQEKRTSGTYRGQAGSQLSCREEPVVGNAALQCWVGGSGCRYTVLKRNKGACIKKGAELKQAPRNQLHPISASPGVCKINVAQAWMDLRPPPKIHSIP